MGQVVSQRELFRRRGEWKRAGEGVVCAYGTFDLLHPGHIRLFEQARDFGDILVVAVQSDDIVRTGSSLARDDGAAQRPITPAAERAEILAALAAVDFVAVVEEPVAEFLRKFSPDVFVDGDEADRSSSSRDTIAPNELERMLSATGCQLVRLPLEPGYSTRRLIERITGNRA